MGKKEYKTPCVLKTVKVLLEKTLLGSVANADSKVRTMGQQVEEYRFDQSTFTPQDWDHAVDQ